MTGFPQILPRLLLSVFGLLVVGGIALSLATAPPVAPQQLHTAAGATVAAPGFVLTDTNSVTALAAAPGASAPTRSEVVHVLYQAPDGVLESGTDSTGQPVSVIVLGARHYRSSGAKWVALPPSPTLGTQAVQTVLAPLRAASDATEVVRSGDTYTFVPPDLSGFITKLLGTNPSQLSSLRLTATVHGEFVTDEQVSAVLGQERLRVDLAFSMIGSAPPVVVPPASDLVPAAAAP